VQHQPFSPSADANVLRPLRSGTGGKRPASPSTASGFKARNGPLTRQEHSGRPSDYWEPVGTGAWSRERGTGWPTTWASPTPSWETRRTQRSGCQILPRRAGGTNGRGPESLAAINLERGSGCALASRRGSSRRKGRNPASSRARPPARRASRTRTSHASDEYGRVGEPRGPRGVTFAPGNAGNGDEDRGGVELPVRFVEVARPRPPPPPPETKTPGGDSPSRTSSFPRGLGLLPAPAAARRPYETGSPIFARPSIYVSGGARESWRPWRRIYRWETHAQCAARPVSSPRNGSGVDPPSSEPQHLQFRSHPRLPSAVGSAIGLNRGSRARLWPPGTVLATSQTRAAPARHHRPSAPAPDGANRRNERGVLE